MATLIADALRLCEGIRSAAESADPRIVQQALAALSALQSLRRFMPARGLLRVVHKIRAAFIASPRVYCISIILVDDKEVGDPHVRLWAFSRDRNAEAERPAMRMLASLSVSDVAGALPVTARSGLTLNRADCVDVSDFELAAMLARKEGMELPFRAGIVAQR